MQPLFTFDRRVIHTVENLTLKEIGEVLNVSESRACQLHAKALTRLRAALTIEA